MHARTSREGHGASGLAAAGTDAEFARVTRASRGGVRASATVREREGARAGLLRPAGLGPLAFFFCSEFFSFLFYLFNS